MKFHAIEVSADYNEFDILVIFFGTEDNYLMIQHSEDEDEADFGAYHIERDDQSYGGYNGVKKWTLKEDSLLVELDAVGQENLDAETIEVTFKINQQEHDNLRAKLIEALGE